MQSFSRNLNYVQFEKTCFSLGSEANFLTSKTGTTTSGNFSINLKNLLANKLTNFISKFQGKTVRNIRSRHFVLNESGVHRANDFYPDMN